MPRRRAARVSGAMPDRVTVIGLNFAPEPTGIAPYTTGAAVALAARGCVVHALVGVPHYPQWRIPHDYRHDSAVAQFGGASVQRHRHHVPGGPGLIGRVRMEVTFGVRTALARWSAPDVVLAVTPGLISTALILVRARLTGVPVVVWVQDIYSLALSESGRGGRLVRVLTVAVERIVLRGARRVVAIHARFARHLTQVLGVPAGRIGVVRNWSHVTLPSIDRPGVRAERGWADDEVVALHAGNMGAKQALENVVLASRLAEERGSRVRFVLLGDGNQREALLAMGTNSCLEFISTLPPGEFERVLLAADILVVNEQPGAAEAAVPSKLTTYFTAGLPVVAATDAASITAEEVMASGGGIVVPPSHPDALLRAVEDLARSSDTRTRLGTAGRAYRDRTLTEDAALDELAAVLAGASSP